MRNKLYECPSKAMSFYPSVYKWEAQECSAFIFEISRLFICFLLFRPSTLPPATGTVLSRWLPRQDHQGGFNGHCWRVCMKICKGWVLGHVCQYVRGVLECSTLLMHALIAFAGDERSLKSSPIRRNSALPFKGTLGSFKGRRNREHYFAAI